MKVGSSLLIDQTRGEVKRRWLEALCDDIAALRAAPDFAAGPQGDMRSQFTEVSQRVLEGRAAMIEGNANAAIAAFTRAAQLQAMDSEGGDPPILWYPTRRSLAAALLLSGDAAAARAAGAGRSAAIAVAGRSRTVAATRSRPSVATSSSREARSAAVASVSSSGRGVAISVV